MLLVFATACSSLPIGGDDVQRLTLVTRNGEGSVGSEEVMPVRFTKLETMG